MENNAVYWHASCEPVTYHGLELNVTDEAVCSITQPCSYRPMQNGTEDQNSCRLMSFTSLYHTLQDIRRPLLAVYRGARQCLPSLTEPFLLLLFIWNLSCISQLGLLSFGDMAAVLGKSFEGLRWLSRPPPPPISGGSLTLTVPVFPQVPRAGVRRSGTQRDTHHSSRPLRRLMGVRDAGAVLHEMQCCTSACCPPPPRKQGREMDQDRWLQCFILPDGGSRSTGWRPQRSQGLWILALFFFALKSLGPHLQVPALQIHIKPFFKVQSCVFFFCLFCRAFLAKGKKIVGKNCGYCILKEKQKQEAGIGYAIPHLLYFPAFPSLLYTIDMSLNA
nr:uncharacterized protein LOC111838391 [Paramormyrops kingsleyae]